MLLIVCPFDAPVVAHRAWCLLEVAMAAVSDVPVEAVICADDEPSLVIEIMDESGHSNLIKMMTSVDSRHAKATNLSDTKNIKRLIESKVEGAYRRVDELFKTSLQAGVLTAGQRLGAQEFEEGTADAATFAARLGQLCVGVNDLDGAITFHQSALATRLSLFGVSDPQVAESLNALGCVHQAHGHIGDAFEHHSRALRTRLEM